MQQARVDDNHPSLFTRFGARVGDFLVANYGLIFMVVFGLILLIAIVNPILSFLGLDVIAKPMFYWMHFLCAQTPSHSFYVFGHQLCLCERCCAIYGSMFLGGLIFVWSKKQVSGIRWWWLLLLSLPMAWDGLTQLVGLRESTWELRLLTGALFGFAVSLFILPFMQRTLVAEAALPRFR